MSAREPRIAPSILSADFARLGDEVRAAEEGGAGVVHLDVMDGHFVPNLTIGPAIVRAVRRVTKLPLDVHLMIEEPDRFLGAFREAGADWISVHVEAVPHLHRTLAEIRRLGARAGVVLNPATPLAALDEALRFCDYVLVMSVNPGFGGQDLIPECLDKIRRLRSDVHARGLAVEIEIDGGVTDGNVADVAAAGAEILVAGSAVFGAGDPRRAVERLRSRAAEGAARFRVA